MEVYMKALIPAIFIITLLAGCTPTQTNQGDLSPAPEASPDAMQESGEAMMEPGDDAIMLEDDEAMMQAKGTEYTIDMFVFGYSVEQIQASPGETITINLTNSDGMHDFDIDELEVDTLVIKEGETNSVTFIIPEDASPGTEYTYYCSVGNHRAQGMEGTIVVQ